MCFTPSIRQTLCVAVGYNISSRGFNLKGEAIKNSSWTFWSSIKNMYYGPNWGCARVCSMQLLNSGFLTVVVNLNCFTFDWTEQCKLCTPTLILVGKIESHIFLVWFFFQKIPDLVFCHLSAYHLTRKTTLKGSYIFCPIHGWIMLSFQLYSNKLKISNLR